MRHGFLPQKAVVFASAAACVWLSSSELHALSFADVLGFFSLNPSKKSAQKASSNYSAGEYSSAASNYQKALRRDKKEPILRYNLGNTYYKQEDFPSAISEYKKALESTRLEPSLRADLHHNMGNSFFSQGNYKEAVEHYKKALDLDDGDLQTKKNLELAMRQLRKTNQSQKSPSDGEEKQNPSKQNSPSGGEENQQDELASKQESPSGEAEQPSTQGSPSGESGEEKKSAARSKKGDPTKDDPSSQGNAGENSQTIPLKVAEQILKALESKGQRFILGRQQTNTIKRSSLDKEW